MFNSLKITPLKFDLWHRMRRTTSSQSNIKKDDKGMYNLFSDSPVGSDGVEDVLGRQEIADEVVHDIDNSNGQMNFLITGPWGIGKTSILKLVQKQFNENEIPWLEFSPWEYSSSDSASSAISRAFLSVLADKLGKGNYTKELYVSKRYEQQRNGISQLIIWISFLLVTFGYVYIFFFFSSLALERFTFLSFLSPIRDYFFDDKNDLSTRVGLLLSIFGVVALPKFGEFFASRIRQEEQVDKAFSPEQMKRLFKKILENSIKNRRIQQMISIWESTFDNTGLSFLGSPSTKFLLYRRLLKKMNITKLIIFIDDLDRCSSSEVNEFLVGMKTFFNDKRVYFVLAADLTKLRILSSEHLGKDAGQPIGELGTDFLRKIIQIDWSVPYPRKAEIELLIGSLCRAAGIDQDKLNIGQITHFSQYNPIPRRIKYYFRRLSFLLNIYKRTNKTAKELNDVSITILYKLIIIADIYPEAFTFLADNPDVYTQVEKNIYTDWKEFDSSGKNNLVPEVEKLKIPSIVAEYPHAGEADIKLSEIFSLVGATEGRVTDTTEFIELSENDSQGAIQFFKNVLWNFSSLANALMGDTEQSLSKMTSPSYKDMTPEEQKRVQDVTSSELETLARIIIGVKKGTINAIGEIEKSVGTLSEKLFETIYDKEISNFLSFFWGDECSDLLVIAAFSQPREGDGNLYSRFISDIQGDIESLDEAKQYIDLVSKYGYFNDAINSKVIEFLVSLIPSEKDTVLSLVSSLKIFELDQLSLKLGDELINLIQTTSDNDVEVSTFSLLANSVKYLTESQKLKLCEVMLAKQDKSTWISLAKNGDLRKELLKSTKIIDALKTGDYNDQNFLNFFESIWKQDLLENSSQKDTFNDLISTVMYNVDSLAAGPNADRYINTIIDKGINLSLLSQENLDHYAKTLKDQIYGSTSIVTKGRITKYINKNRRRRA